MKIELELNENAPTDMARFKTVLGLGVELKLIPSKQKPKQQEEKKEKKPKMRRQKKAKKQTKQKPETPSMSLFDNPPTTKTKLESQKQTEVSKTN